ncbi:MAG: hypothetical protein H7829_18040 [Magnetococcus sp. THC-1_WYH]
MKRFAKPLLLIILSIITVFTVTDPRPMISPGSLIPGHAPLERDCFACHEPFLGTSSARCITCHKIDAIGVTNTKGVVITKKGTKTRFHHQLTNNTCTACHSDHAGVARYRTKGQFSHGALDTALAGQCSQCHQPPDDALHRSNVTQCSKCHGQGQWKPANLDHKPWFELDKDHHVPCNRCHLENNYKTYTCTDCHEHSADKIRKEHLEEGIHDYERCVRCHRNTNEEDAKRRWHAEGGKPKHEDEDD